MVQVKLQVHLSEKDHYRIMLELHFKKILFKAFLK